MQALGRAEQRGVKLTLEGVGKSFLFDTALLLAMIEACGGSQSLGIYLDVGNSTRGGMDPAAEIRGAGSRALLCHVKDWNPNDSLGRRLGAGAVDFPRSLVARRSVEFMAALVG
jgi:sugar phosphate isomerase/epimerase